MKIASYQTTNLGSESTIKLWNKCTVYHTARQCLEKRNNAPLLFLMFSRLLIGFGTRDIWTKFKNYFHTRSIFIWSPTSVLECSKQNFVTSDHLSSVAGPQGPVVYNIITSDLPQISNVILATYAGDDVTFLACNRDPNEPSSMLQLQFNAINGCLNKWRIKVPKFLHITFALRRSTCHWVTLGSDALL